MSFTISNLTLQLQKSETTPLIEQLNLTIQENEFLIIQGKSGCGKSSLLKSIVGFIEPNKKKGNFFSWGSRKWFNSKNDNHLKYSGEIYLNENLLNNLDPRDRSIGYLMQNSKIYPHHNCPKDVLYFPYKVNPRIREAYNNDENKYLERAKEVFNSLHLKVDFEGKINSISGGEEQRLLLGKYILMQPEVLLLDEPFTNLDYENRELMRGIILDLVKNNHIKYIIMVSHDIEDCLLADKILFFLDSRNHHLITSNQFESAFEVYSRLYGNWKNYNGQRVKNNIITKLLGSAKNEYLISSVLNDFFKLFQISIVTQAEIKRLIKEEWQNDNELESEIKKLLFLRDNRLHQSLLEKRAATISSQIAEHIKGQKICDFGCGDGLVTVNLKNNNSQLDIDLYDISDYRNPNANDFNFYNKESEIPINNLYETTLLLTVLHHTDQPTKVLKNILSITKNRIIIIESVLGISKEEKGDFEEHNTQRVDYARLVDWTYNRIVQDNVPVPYNFLCVEDWLNIFASLNLTCIYQQDLGKDIDIVPEHHYMFVLEKS